MFNDGIIHAECLGGDIDLLLNQRAVIGCFPWRLVDGESCISRIVAFVDHARHAELRKAKAGCRLTKHGDVAGALYPELHGVRQGQRARREVSQAALDEGSPPRIVQMTPGGPTMTDARDPVFEPA